ncbi:P-loop containing nucleoside triphosphate hydrolase protein [Hypoxylon argillaceum]|nr:P-loop containing nucleoside triphosphate hydrolase protein [Hypoxylon argillaceum]
MSNPSIRIAVFGSTGAGKTSFINQATGANLKVGNGAASSTKKVQRVEVSSDKVGGRKVILIDTPGFNDMDLEEPRLFLHIANWLANSLHNGECLNGAIFLQGINAVRVLKGEENGVKLFETIVGTKAFSQVVVATTMWDQVEQDFGVRNEENRARVWDNLKTGRAKFYRFYNTEHSALEINNLDMKVKDVRAQVRISGSTNKLRETVKRLRSWLRELITSTIRLGASAWGPVTAVGAIVRVWVWEIQS